MRGCKLVVPLRSQNLMYLEEPFLTVGLLPRRGRATVWLYIYVSSSFLRHQLKRLRFDLPIGFDIEMFRSKSQQVEAP
jgi:hypothetical protein